jgi:hypothetical protein
MCEAISILIAGASLLGSGLSAAGQLQAGAEQKKLAEKNAKLAELAATDAEARGGVQAGLVRMRGSRTASTQRAAYGASGADAASGTALSLYGDTAAVSELDAQTARSNAAREAWGYRTQAEDFRAQGALAERQAAYGAASTVLGGVAQFGTSAVKAGRPGKGK